MDISNNNNHIFHDFVNHSGGANGADKFWDKIGQEFGVYNHRHYWWGKKTSLGNIHISPADYDEGIYEAAKAAKRLYGYQSEKLGNSLLVRNWAQVKYSEALFAIGIIVKKGEKLRPKIENDKRISLIPAVIGGTGQTICMAINHHKPVYVFNQTENNFALGWHIWNYEISNFIKTETPVLTKQFAGIGTRDINENGIQAIREVYENTLLNYSMSYI